MSNPSSQQSRKVASVHGQVFEDLKAKAASKGFKAVYIDRLREQAVMLSMFSETGMAEASHDHIRSVVAKVFNDSMESVGGFSEAYQRERSVVKTVGRQLPERKFDETLQIMSLLVNRLDDKKESSSPALERIKNRFLMVVSETSSLFSAFNLDTKEVLRRVEREPVLVKHGINNQVKAILEGQPVSVANKITAGNFLTRPINFQFRPAR